jgi:hypothetical protein
MCIELTERGVFEVINSDPGDSSLINGIEGGKR